MSAMSAPNAPERIDAPERQTLWVCPDCSSVADLVGHEPPPRLRCSHAGGEWDMVPVPYVRADRVTPDMIDRGARKLAQLWGDVEWDKLEPEAVESYRRDAEAVLRAALHREVVPPARSRARALPRKARAPMADIVDELRRVLEGKDGRTIEEMIAAEPVEEFVVEEATPGEGGTLVTFDGGLSTFLKGPEVKVGDTIGLFTGGRPVLGSERHGWSLNGRVIEWKTPWERVADRVQWLANYDREKRERFAKERARLDEQYAALPTPLKDRIDRFRRGDPAFRIEGEAYEMYVVADAAKIADHLRPRVEAGKDPEEVVTEFHGLPWEQQKAIGLQDGHSNNTFGAACALARALLAGEPV